MLGRGLKYTLMLKDEVLFVKASVANPWPQGR